jgi:uncharacterized protein YjdB
MKGACLMIGVAIVACGSDRIAQTAPVDTPLAVCVDGPTVSPASATLRVGDTLRVRAPAELCANPVQWRWHSSDTVVASIDSLDGLVRAKRQGSASIVNELLSDRNEKGAAAITVTP